MAKRKKNDDVMAVFEEEMAKDIIPKKLSVLPLRDVVIYPNMIYPVLIGRQASIRAVATAMDRSKYIFVTAQKAPDTEEPGFDDLYLNGTVAKVVQVLRLPNNLLKVLIEGEKLAVMKPLKTKNDFLEANVTYFDYDESLLDKELLALYQTMSKLFEDYVKKEVSIPYDTIMAFNNIINPLNNTRRESMSEVV